MRQVLDPEENSCSWLKEKSASGVYLWAVPRGTFLNTEHKSASQNANTLGDYRWPDCGTQKQNK